MGDYNRYYEENRKLRETQMTLKDEKENAYNEINRIKTVHFTTVNELKEDNNMKVSQY